MEDSGNEVAIELVLCVIALLHDVPRAAKVDAYSIGLCSHVIPRLCQTPKQLTWHPC